MIYPTSVNNADATSVVIKITGDAAELTVGDKHRRKDCKQYKSNNMKNGLVTDEYGNKRWYKNDNLHREDGPAIELPNGNKHWYKDGLMHREDGPADEYANGTKYWYKYGKLHREDGPAIEWYDDHKEWYLDGKQLTEQEFNKNKIDAKAISSLSDDQFNGLSVSVDDMEYLVLLAHYKDMDLNQMVGKLISDFVKTELMSMLKEKIDKRITA